jgi:cytidyltransferase-like protein
MKTEDKVINTDEGVKSRTKYNIGYVPGVFDLFHVGHLNLLRNSKERCNYLIAGVLTDELVTHFKGRPPFIPFEERRAIVESIRYVDKVVAVDFSNTVKIDAWKLYHFDCHFSGNDHGPEWDEDLRQLREVGSNMEFLPYTHTTNSTQIRKLIERALI